MSKLPGPDHIWYRWIAGQPLDGRYRTDGTFWKAGQRQLSKTPVRRWAYRPGWQRSAVRNGVVTALVVILWQYRTHPTRTVSALVTVAVAAALYGALRAYQAFRVRQANRKYVVPLGTVLGPLLGYSPDTRPAEFVTVPAGWEKDEKRPVTVALPATFAGTEGTKAQVTEVMLGRLGRSGDQMSVNFRMVGRSPVVAAAYRPQPPNMFALKDAMPFIDELEPGQILIGMGARNKPAVMDFNTEDPHLAVNANTGTGKSTQLMCMGAQVIRQGGQIHALDPKITSFDPLVGVPGFFIANDPSNVEAFWDGIRRVHKEFKRRRVIFGNDRSAEFPLWFMFIDEMTMFRKIDRQYWAEIKEKKDLMTSPGAKMLDELILMGRQYGIRVVVSGQIINEGIMWNNLSVFANRALAKYDENAWKRLFGGFPFEVPSTRPGRWVYRFGGGSPTWVQNIYATDVEIRELAMSGRSQVSPVDVPSGAGDATVRGDGDQGTGDIVGVKAMADYAGVDYETFKKRRTRAEGIPGERKVAGQFVVSRSDLDAFLGRAATPAP
jgi:hypothetical protein